MADADDVRRVALSLPHVVEIASDGFDFRVGGKGFVWSYPERSPGKRRVIRTDVAVLFVGEEAEKQALLLGEPDVFFTTPAYDGWPLVMLWLEQVDADRVTELVTDAWRMRAPVELAADLDSRPNDALHNDALHKEPCTKSPAQRALSETPEHAARSRGRLPPGARTDVEVVELRSQRAGRLSTCRRRVSWWRWCFTPAARTGTRRDARPR